MAKLSDAERATAKAEKKKAKAERRATKRAAKERQRVVRTAARNDVRNVELQMEGHRQQSSDLPSMKRGSGF